MEISDKSLALIKGAEGYHKVLPDGRCQAYLDTLANPPVWTIGWGCTKGVTEGMVWTRAKAESQLRSEVRRHAAEIDELVEVPLTQSQYDALVSFQYNTGGLGKSTLLKKLNKGDYEGAAREFPHWNKAGGKVRPGLVTRRAAEMAMFLTPDASNEPTMPQVVDVPTPVMTAVQSSRTIFGILTAAGASLVGWFKDAVDQVALFEPVKQLGSGLGLNLTTIVFAITVAGLGLALFARLDDAWKGNVVK